MKTNVTMAILTGVLLSTAMNTPVLAEKHKQTHTPPKLTCDEFLAYDDVVKPKIVYWAEGFNKKGKPVDAVIDVEATDKIIPVLITECQKAPKESFWNKIKELF